MARPAARELGFKPYRFRGLASLYCRDVGTWASMTTIDEIRDNFEILDEWDDRYRYVIELGRTLEPMPEAEHSAANKVNGCVSQVWLQKLVDRSNGAPILKYRGDSDAHIVRGLVAIVLSLYFGPHAAGNSRDRCNRRVRRVRLSRSSDAAALQRPALDGRAHQDRRQRGARGSFLGIYFRFRCCCPRPICFASCERATA